MHVQLISRVMRNADAFFPTALRSAGCSAGFRADSSRTSSNTRISFDYRSHGATLSILIARKRHRRNHRQSEESGTEFRDFTANRGNKSEQSLISTDRAGTRRFEVTGIAENSRRGRRENRVAGKSGDRVQPRVSIDVETSHRRRSVPRS